MLRVHSSFLQLPQDLFISELRRASEDNIRTPPSPRSRMSQLFLFDISSASARSVAQARRHVQSEQTAHDRRERRNELRRQRSRTARQDLDEIGIMQPTGLTPCAAHGVAQVASMNSTCSTINEQHLLHDTSDQIGAQFVQDEIKSDQFGYSECRIQDAEQSSTLSAQVAVREADVTLSPTISCRRTHEGVNHPVPPLWVLQQAMDPWSQAPEIPITSTWMQQVIDECSSVVEESDHSLVNNDPSLFRVALCVRLKNQWFIDEDWSTIHRWLFPYIDLSHGMMVFEDYNGQVLAKIGARMYQKLGLQHCINMNRAKMLEISSFSTGLAFNAELVSDKLDSF